MKYKTLLNELSKLTPEQLEMDCSVWLSESDEFCPVVRNVCMTDETDVLDKNHPFLTIEF